MLRIRFTQAGEPAEVLEAQETTIPEPQAGEVLIKVAASPINPSDTMFTRGLYGLKPALPDASVGFEGAGEITEVGEGVEIPVGTRVMFTHIGTWAEYVAISAKSVVPVPNHWSDEVACQSFVNPFTAWAMLHESGLQAGDWLLLTAGGSAFSQLVIQLAKSKGIKTIATLRREDQVEQLKAIGLDAYVNTSQDKVHRKVAEITGGQGASACFEAVGGETGSQALKALKPGGQMFIYGLLSLQNPQVDSGQMIFKGLKVAGFWLTTWMTQASNEAKKQMRQEVFQLLGTDDLKVAVEARYSFKDIKEAVTHAEKPGRKGKILLKAE